MFPVQTTELLQLFILQLIYKHPKLDNQYGLTRFFRKSILPSKYLYGTLDDMEQQALISTREIRNTIKYYNCTGSGRELLSRNYSINKLEPYLREIDYTGYYVSILRLIEQHRKS